MSRAQSALRILAPLAGAVVLSSCASWFNKASKPKCGSDYSNAFGATVGAAPTLPVKLRPCGVKANKSSLVNILEPITIKFDNTANGAQGISSSYYWFWTKNAHDYTNGPAKGDTLQASGEWQKTRELYVAYSPTYNANHAFEDWEAPLDVHIGWPTSGGVLERDSLHMTFSTYASFPDATYGNYSGVYWLWFNVRNGVVSATVVEPSSLQSGISATWDLVPSDDTTGYRVDWYWEGSLQSSFQDKFTFTKTMPVAGTYTLRADQHLYDTTFTFTRSVVVPVNVTLTGSAMVSNSVTNYYSASASGGTAGYSYQWYIDGSPYSTASSFAAPYWVLYSDHHVEVFVTDANGATGYADIWVFVSSCDPEDPNCQPELRANPRSAPVRPPPKQRPVNVTQPMLRRP